MAFRFNTQLRNQKGNKNISSLKAIKTDLSIGFVYVINHLLRYADRVTHRENPKQFNSRMFVKTFLDIYLLPANLSSVEKKSLNH